MHPQPLGLRGTGRWVGQVGGTRAGGRPHLEQQVVLEHPLHGHHQQVLQPELAVLDLQRALLGREPAVRSSPHRLGTEAGPGRPQDAATKLRRVDFAAPPAPWDTRDLGSSMASPQAPGPASGPGPSGRAGPPLPTRRWPLWEKQVPHPVLGHQPPTSAGARAWKAWPRWSHQTGPLLLGTAAPTREMRQGLGGAGTKPG